MNLSRCEPLSQLRYNPTPPPPPARVGHLSGWKRRYKGRKWRLQGQKKRSLIPIQDDTDLEVILGTGDADVKEYYVVVQDYPAFGGIYRKDATEFAWEGETFRLQRENSCWVIVPRKRSAVLSPMRGIRSEFSEEKKTPTMMKTWKIEASARWHLCTVSITDLQKVPVQFYGHAREFGEFCTTYVSYFQLEGQEWPSVEHYYYAQKFTEERDREEIRACVRPVDVIKTSRQLSSIRKDWSDIRIIVMTKALRAKFMQGNRVRQKLLSTGRRELHFSHISDSFWGTGPDDMGLNHLGRLLESVRSEAAEWTPWPTSYITTDATDEPIRFHGVAVSFGQFSNCWVSQFKLKGNLYASVEHYFQSQKFEGSSREEQIRMAATPELAFQMGRNRLFPCRYDWDKIKLRIMRESIMAKFAQDLELRELLLSTRNRMILFSDPKDSLYGIGEDGKGQNLLGNMLMEVRQTERDVGRTCVNSDMKQETQSILSVEGESAVFLYHCTAPYFSPFDTRRDQITSENGFCNLICDIVREMFGSQAAILPAFMFTGNRLHSAPYVSVDEECVQMSRFDYPPLTVPLELLKDELSYPGSMMLLSLYGLDIRKAMEFHHQDPESSCSRCPIRKLLLFPHVSGLRVLLDSKKKTPNKVFQILIEGRNQSYLPIEDHVIYRIAIPSPLWQGIAGSKSYYSGLVHTRTSFDKIPLQDLVLGYLHRDLSRVHDLFIDGRMRDVSKSINDWRIVNTDD